MSQLLRISCFHLKEAQNKLKTSQVYSLYIQLWMHGESPKPLSLCVKWTICTNIPAGQIVSVLHKQVVGSKSLLCPYSVVLCKGLGPLYQICVIPQRQILHMGRSMMAVCVSERCQLDEHLLHVSSYNWEVLLKMDNPN